VPFEFAVVLRAEAIAEGESGGSAVFDVASNGDEDEHDDDKRGDADLSVCEVIEHPIEFKLHGDLLCIESERGNGATQEEYRAGSLRNAG
jgi:hypothetical protein